MEIQLSNNFWLSEFLHSQTAQRHPDIAAHQFAPPDAIVTNLRYLCENSIQPLRTLLNVPMRISSGYRCEALNQAIGGSNKSQHIQGEAADIVMSDRIIQDPDLGREKTVIENMCYERVGKYFRNDVNANFYLFAAACLFLDELDIDQLIHEYGNQGQPAWIHISASQRRNNRQILLLPDKITLTLEEAILLGC